MHASLPAAEVAGTDANWSVKVKLKLVSTTLAPLSAVYKSLLGLSEMVELKILSAGVVVMPAVESAVRCSKSASVETVLKESET